MSATSEEAVPQRYRVRAPFVTIRVPSAGEQSAGAGAAVNPWRLVQLGCGDWVPQDANPDDIARLLRRRIDTGPVKRRGPLIEPVEL